MQAPKPPRRDPVELENENQQLREQLDQSQRRIEQLERDKQNLNRNIERLKKELETARRSAKRAAHHFLAATRKSVRRRRAESPARGTVVTITARVRRRSMSRSASICRASARNAEARWNCSASSHSIRKRSCGEL